ncbi:uncharacterized protein LAESUDRAFT_656750, partial [Laetiporus sulphureus 93-53]
YSLAGIVYAGGFHFTCQFIASDGSVWYHDGRQTGRSCHLESTTAASVDLLHAHDRDATILLYVLDH